MFTDNMITYIKKKNLVRQPFKKNELMGNYSKVTEYTINILSQLFSHRTATNNKS